MSARGSAQGPDRPLRRHVDVPTIGRRAVPTKNIALAADPVRQLRVDAVEDLAHRLPVALAEGGEQDHVADWGWPSAASAAGRCPGRRRRSAASRTRAPSGSPRPSAAPPRRRRRGGGLLLEPARAGRAGRSARVKPLPNSMPPQNASNRSTSVGSSRCAAWPAATARPGSRPGTSAAIRCGSTKCDEQVVDAPAPRCRRLRLSTPRSRMKRFSRSGSRSAIGSMPASSMIASRSGTPRPGRRQVDLRSPSRPRRPRRRARHQLLGQLHAVVGSRRRPGTTRAS